MIVITVIAFPMVILLLAREVAPAAMLIVFALVVLTVAASSPFFPREGVNMFTLGLCVMATVCFIA